MMRLSISVALVCLAVAAATPALGKTVSMRTSWYQCCKVTADGTAFSANNPHIAAHRSLPFGTKLLLRHKGRSLCVTVRDRGPFTKKNGKYSRDLDVTKAAALHLGFIRAGVVNLGAKINGC